MIYRKEDKDGNILSISSEGKVTLKLSKESPRIRNIGEYSNKEYSKYDEEKHIFRKLNAWSINYEMFKISNVITINTKQGSYKLDTKNVDGQLLTFKETGIETKIYLPLELWKR